MARISRVIAVGLPHHVTQRGNGRRDVFVTDLLKRTYLELLWREAGEFRLRILAYCIMTSHVHLVAMQETEAAMGMGLRRAHGRFAQFWNTAQASVGHMWQNRYYSCPVKPAGVWSVIRYVELNPVRAGMARNALDYQWSSAGAHVMWMDPAGLLDMEWWRGNWGEGDWETALADADFSDHDAIRRAT